MTLDLVVMVVCLRCCSVMDRWTLLGVLCPTDLMTAGPGSSAHCDFQKAVTKLLKIIIIVKINVSPRFYFLWDSPKYAKS